MSNPKYLLKLKIRIERALNSEPPDGLTGFVVAWMLWEAVQRRILVLACKREGWTIEQTRGILSEEKLDIKRFTELFRAITEGNDWADSLPIAARRLWPGILKADDLRKRIIYGTSRIGEENLQKAAWNVLRFLNRLRDHSLGDPLRDLPKKSRKNRSNRSLSERI